MILGKKKKKTLLLLGCCSWEGIEPSPERELELAGKGGRVVGGCELGGEVEGSVKRHRKVTKYFTAPLLCLFLKLNMA